jgi:hypothetical protein
LSVLSLPLEEKLSSCPLDFLHSKCKEMSHSAVVRSRVGHP